MGLPKYKDTEKEILEEKATAWRDPNVQTLEYLAKSNSVCIGMTVKISLETQRRIGILRMLSWYFSSGTGKTQGDRVWSLSFFPVRRVSSTL